MPTKGWRRTWIKLFVTGWLHGSIRWQLEPDERSVWADLICLAGECGHQGKICDNDGEALPRDFIANQLNIKRTLLDRTIAKSIHNNRLIEENGCLLIKNWGAYQSEYDRQKPYRERKKTNAIWETMPEEEKNLAIECFGPIEGWDNHTWVAVTRKLPDSEWELIQEELAKPK